MPDWKPIETAPMDRTPILIYAWPDMAVAIWYIGDPGEGIEPFWAVWDGDDYVPAFRHHLAMPTHWLPLPDKPLSAGN